ncbi:cysteine desulfurase-like protein [Microlunatus ginsengisoli]|uniref:Cysteine desulfurase-like protein n=1 Tax=Microlunatus ginsengisoli TaxID=363863 RepID=A0ABP7AXU1_9ACTN
MTGRPGSAPAGPDAHFDVDRIRADFPALAAGSAHFDSPGGTQTPAVVAAAIARTLSEPLANRGPDTPAARNAERAVFDFRRAVADFVRGDPRGVVFGRSATELTMTMARTLASTWAAGDEVIVSRLDHDANIRPWLIAVERVGAVVRWADFDPATGALPTEAVTDLLTERTRVVAITAASNLIGTRPDVAAIADRAHAAGAYVYVDGVHYASHLPVDVAALGADFFVCSPYKFFGPHHGVLVTDPGLLETLRPDKLLPSTDAVPERFELGTLPYELLAGTTAAIDYLAAMVPGSGSRRERLAGSIAAAEAHQVGSSRALRAGLLERGAVLHGADAPCRTSTLLFDLPGWAAPDLAGRLAERGVSAPAGSFYAVEASRHLGLGDGGAVRVGLAPYTCAEDVRRLLAALDDLPDRG